MSALPPESIAATTRPRADMILLVGLGVLLLAHSVWLFAPSDDTYIYLVFAKNLLNGHGLTFNGAKVQGFTSPLWMALISALGMLRVPLEAAPRILSGLAGLWTLWLCHRAARRLGFSPTLALACPLLLALHGDFAFYAGVGLENVLFAATTVGCLLLLLELDANRSLNDWRTPLMLGACALTRPEGLAVVAIVLLDRVLRARSTRATLRCVSLLIPILGLPALAQRLYFGDWIPNTFYAKAGAGFANLANGLGYFLNYLSYDGLLLLLGVLALFIADGAVRRARIPLAAILLVILVDATVRGGDNLLGFRAYLSILPLITLLALSIFRRAPARWVLAASLLIGIHHVAAYRWGVVLGASTYTATRDHRVVWKRHFGFRKDIALHLREQLPDDALIALNAAGVIPYFVERPVIDMLGLNDRHIAREGKRDRKFPYGHQAGDGEYVLERRPDVILFSGTGENKASFLSDQEIAQSDEFLRWYDPQKIPHRRIAYMRRATARETLPPGNQQDR